jgi:hypothetical protein
MEIGITVYPNIIASLGPGKGILFSQLINLCYINEWAKASGSDLSITTGMPAKQCTTLLEELIVAGLVRMEDGLVQVVRTADLPSPERKKKVKSSKTEEEKQIIAMAHALYAKRMKASSDFVGNKFTFINELKKMSLAEAEIFAMAVDAWVEEVEQGKAVMGMHTFLSSGAWKRYAEKGSRAHVDYLKTLIPMINDNQYDVTSDEYLRYREAYQRYHAPKQEK